MLEVFMVRRLLPLALSLSLALVPFALRALRDDGRAVDAPASSRIDDEAPLVVTAERSAPAPGDGAPLPAATRTAGFTLTPLDDATARVDLALALEHLRDLSSPLPRLQGAHIYFAATGTDGRRLVHMRRATSTGAAAEILLDESELAAGHAYFALGAYDVSPDGKRLAYATDARGDERYTLFVNDVDTSQRIAGPIPSTDFSVAWEQDGRGLFYTALDAQALPRRVHHLELSTMQNDVIHEAEASDATVLVARIDDARGVELFERSKQRLQAFKLERQEAVEQRVRPFVQVDPTDAATDVPRFPLIDAGPACGGGGGGETAGSSMREHPAIR